MQPEHTTKYCSRQYPNFGRQTPNEAIGFLAGINGSIASDLAALAKDAFYAVSDLRRGRSLLCGSKISRVGFELERVSRAHARVDVAGLARLADEVLKANHPFQAVTMRGVAAAEGFARELRRLALREGWREGWISPWSPEHEGAA